MHELYDVAPRRGTFVLDVAVQFLQVADPVCFDKGLRAGEQIAELLAYKGGFIGALREKGGDLLLFALEAGEAHRTEALRRADIFAKERSVGAREVIGLHLP